MKNYTAIICSTMLVLASLLLFASRTVKAQSGNVIFLGAAVGTTLALNCPAVPTTPSVCVVGDGVWVWESSTTGWFKPVATIATAGVTSIAVNGGTAQTGAVALTIPGKATSTTTTVLQ